MTTPQSSFVPMHVYSAGAVTSVGTSLATTQAAISAGLDNFQDTAFVDGGNPIIGAAIHCCEHPTLPNPEARGHERLAAFLRMAIEECFINAGITLPCEQPIPILLVLGEADRYGRSDALVATCQDAYASLLSAAHQTPFYRAEVGCVGVVDALIAANNIIANQDTSLVLLVGVDSWLNVPDIQYALGYERLLSQENASGFIPSEGAAAVLLGAPQYQSKLQNSVQICITGVGKADEAASLYTQEPCYGKGLANAIRNALNQASITLSDIMLELTDLTSEPYFFEEVAYARNRLLRTSMQEGYKRIHPAGSTGNMGAAFGPLLLGIAWQSVQSQSKQSPILITLSSAGSARGAIVATCV